MMPFAERRRETASFLDDALTRVQAKVKRRPSMTLNGFRTFLEDVERFGDEYQTLADDSISVAAEKIKLALSREGLAESIVARSFALIRECSQRLLGMQHHPVQLIGGYALLKGRLAEMETGEGKTLTALLPAATAALAGVPVHIVTVNDYLAQRDADQLRPVYENLGLTVGLVLHGQDPSVRSAAYACDVAYCTNKELTFDYLRDTIALRGRRSGARVLLDKTIGDGQQASQLLLRGLHFAIVDEADSVLVDEARTPLIISRETDDPAATEIYRAALDLAKGLRAGEHYRLLGSERAVRLTERGRALVAGTDASAVGGLWASRRVRLELVEQALSALHLFKRDVHYIVTDGKVQIVDEYTGRVMADRSWERGLHQLVETKEGCKTTGRRETLAQITYQRFFRRYLWLAGMTGTAAEISTELQEVYGLEVVRIPTHRGVQRRNVGVYLCRTAEEKWRKVAAHVRELRKLGRPVLIGTRSVEASEQLSALLNSHGLGHTVLNARQDAEEAAIVAAAGEAGRVTVATNMAGRGTDIRLAQSIVQSGGLHVVLTEFHESARIDRQLFGRCARQGDPGSFEAIVSLEDELFRRYARVLARIVYAIALGRPELASGLFCRLLRWLAQHSAENRNLAARRQTMKQDAKLEKALAFAGAPE
ncbi:MULTISPECIES: DEAD/DEAH box helicase [Mesorhizobium]|uniref:Protein translocase subunit SecA n=2 Tax=Mesorhizobium ciceri TaxID=39645 RepID=A0AB38TNE1_9HYPH|nr:MULTISPECIES: DEAD/DEAH box helicase [Mesorhizobium]MDF3216822.1 prepilin peptidase [Mesorhizobium ciceri]UTU55226.1 prepilin peptidase [Mesorhizobium ciceri]